MPWERPASVPYPNVWWTFKAPDPDRKDGGLATYRVEDLTEDRFEDTMKLYTEHFLDDEPLCAHRLTVVCYKEGSKELVGANLLVMSMANDKVDFMNLRYGVDMYLTAYGLSVNTRFRGLGIATEILKARIPICRAFGVKLTSTNFTAIGSQKAAAKVGFKTDLEIPCNEFVKVNPKYTLDGIKSKSLKMMSLVIDDQP
ncbi:hypothetical protein AND_006082 [Anopheles darlingi]|uniref:N-acetyltransferase domain-containing protein n=1 Tax=Anopheles darlingi TaxID=43151 RepID=W5JHE4_ANODA|nr:hypothetical protein AND_006082 [Anopheles darlingi]